MNMEPHTWKIEWDNSMSVGIPEIDEDHKRFVLLIGELNQAIAGRMDLGEIKKRLQLILDDARRHFEHEEQLLNEWKYPDAENHANKHAQAINALQAIMSKLISYDLKAEWIDAGLAVKDILINHLLTEDMKYAEYYRNSRMAAGKQ